MRAVQVWQDQVSDPATKSSYSLYSVAFRPDGEQILVAAKKKILVYDGSSGNLVKSLPGHKEDVYSVAYAANGEMFASGGADKTVIVWDKDLNGILKYSHNDSVQCLAFNPLSSHLVSCGVTEVGIWTVEQKGVNKHKISAKASSCCWTNDGQYFAVGMQNGVVSIRNKVGDEKYKVERPGGSPIWCLTWNSTKDDVYDILCVCDWNRKLAFYHLNGKQIGKERSFNFDPTCITPCSGGSYLLIGGSNKKLSLYSRDGIFLCTVAELNSQVWCVQTKPKEDFVTAGCDDGTLLYIHLVYSTIHGLYRERYAYRDNMTDVVIQHLLTDQKVRIKCREQIKKIAIYKNRLAVQLPEKIVVYELFGNETSDMQYKVREKIQQKLDCTLLVVCTGHIILCQDKKLSSLTYSGRKEREWNMESQIRYIKVVGGIPGNEELLIGLKHGQVYQVFLSNSFPVLLLKHQSSVRCLDISAMRTKLALVDENNTCVVYDMKKKEILFQEPNANSVSWNSLCDDMLCFTGGGYFNIKANGFPVHQQRQAGFVVGYYGSSVFCLNQSSVVKVEVPQSSPTLQYMERKMFNDAYGIACLGVTEDDWKVLAFEALENLDLEVAQKALVRIGHLPHLLLIQSILERKKRGQDNDKVYLADILAHQGKFDKAARLYKEADQSSKAVEMYTDLRQFDLAKEYMEEGCSEGFTKEIIKKQAEWCKSSSDPKAACEMYLAAGEYIKAADIMMENGWIDRLLQMTRNPSTNTTEFLQHCAKLFQNSDQIELAAEILDKLGEWKELIKLYVDAQQWNQAFNLLKDHPELKELVYVPHAMWLLENDQFNEAQDALSKAGRQTAAVNILEQLVENAIVETRFEDCAYYNWLLASSYRQHAKEPPKGEKSEVFVKQFWNHLKLAGMYYAYSGIHKFTDQPFTSHLPDALFNMSRCLYHQLLNTHPPGISKVCTLYTLARQSKHLGAFKLARYAFDKLQMFIIPQRFSEQVELGSITIRSKPFEDKEELLPVCYHCSTTNPLLNTEGLQCVNCLEPFIFSFVSFELLPLVEFCLDSDISEEEAKALVAAEPIAKRTAGPHETADCNTQTLTLDSEDDKNDLFTEKLLNTEMGSSVYTPVCVDKETLRSMHQSQIFVKEWGAPLGNQYFFNVLPDVPISMCNNCFQMFHNDDYELQTLLKRCCPFCRAPCR